MSASICEWKDSRFLKIHETFTTVKECVSYFNLAHQRGIVKHIA